MHSMCQNQNNNLQTDLKTAFSLLSNGKKRLVLRAWFNEYNTCLQTFYNKINQKVKVRKSELNFLINQINNHE